jgi:hypothetical protein
MLRCALSHNHPLCSMIATANPVSISKSLQLRAFVLQDECAVRLTALFAAFVSAGSSISVESLEAVGHTASNTQIHVIAQRAVVWALPGQQSKTSSALKSLRWDAWIRRSAARGVCAAARATRLGVRGARTDDVAARTGSTSQKTWQRGTYARAPRRGGGPRSPLQNLDAEARRQLGATLPTDVDASTIMTQPKVLGDFTKTLRARRWASLQSAEARARALLARCASLSCWLPGRRASDGGKSARPRWAAPGLAWPPLADGVQRRLALRVARSGSPICVQRISSASAAKAKSRAGTSPSAPRPGRPPHEQQTATRRQARRRACRSREIRRGRSAGSAYFRRVLHCSSGRRPTRARTRAGDRRRSEAPDGVRCRAAGKAAAVEAGMPRAHGVERSGLRRSRMGWRRGCGWSRFTRRWSTDEQA